MILSLVSGAQVSLLQCQCHKQLLAYIPQLSMGAILQKKHFVVLALLVDGVE